jgi:hypothetical protein
MPKLAQRALIALAIATTLPAAACAERTDWTAAPSGKTGLVRLRIERNAPNSHNSNEDDVAATALAGLDLNRDGDQHFTLRREAGSLDCTGVVRSHHGVGECQFTPDRAFAAALVRYGMAEPNEHDAFTLAMVDAHLATAQALSHFGTHPSLGDYVALSIHGANPQWIEELSRAGQRNIKPRDLIAYRIHGVTGAWLHGLVAADPALAGADSGNIIGMRIQGVQPDWVQGLADAGYRNLAPNELIAMRIHGVTPEFARAAMAMGGRPSAQELISQRITGRR